MNEQIFILTSEMSQLKIVSCSLPPNLHNSLISSSLSTIAFKHEIMLYILYIINNKLHVYVGFEDEVKINEYIENIKYGVREKFVKRDKNEIGAVSCASMYKKYIENKGMEGLYDIMNQMLEEYDREYFEEIFRKIGMEEKIAKIEIKKDRKKCKIM